MDIRTVHQSGAGSNGVDVVVVSTGFEPEELEAFRRLELVRGSARSSSPPLVLY
jgi:hypothetical protein